MVWQTDLGPTHVVARGLSEEEHEAIWHMPYIDIHLHVYIYIYNKDTHTRRRRAYSPLESAMIEGLSQLSSPLAM